MTGKKFFLLTVDDLRRDKTSLENDRDTTPFLGEFAKENTYQNNHYSIAPASPGSFRNIFSSTYPKEFDDGDSLSTDRPYLPEILAQNKVKTVGITTNPYVSTSYGFHRGYDRFEDTVIDNRQKSISRFTSILKDIARNMPFKEYLRTIRDEFRGKSTPYMEADELVNLAKEVIIDEERDENQFFWFHFMEPHYPFVPPEETFGTWSDLGSRKDAWKVLEEGSPEEVLDLYDECVLFFDRNLKKLVEFIEERYEDEEYEIIITSDHGELFLEESIDTYGHPSILDEKLYEVPLFITGNGSVDRNFSTHNDIVPTILDFFDIEIPGEMKGVSLHSKEEKNYDFVQTHEFSREDLDDNTREPKAGKITKEGIVESTSLRNPDNSKSDDLVENAKNTYYFKQEEDPNVNSELTEDQEKKVKENLRQLGYDE